ncbi:MAG: desulfoferrodoxin Dfx [Clostridiales bacterium]|nr:desulfoferrodoxin Dfx [Clostridiales bacterium]
MKFFKGKCGTVVTKLFEAECQGGPLEELIPNTTDAAGEKHVPVISINGQEVTVTVGEVAHPMMDAHYITFVALETDKSAIIRQLKPGEEPVAKFTVAPDEKVIAAYEYCNLHGLWMANA